MKKLALALVCFASVAFFASCNPEGQPTISVLNQEGYVQDGATVDVNTEVNFGFVVASSATTNKELASLVVKVDDTEWANKDLTGMTEYTYTDKVTYEYNRDEIVGTSVITATVTDAAGQVATSTITLTLNQPDQPLTSTPIEWVRKGANLIGNTEAEMNAAGLQWTGSYKEVFATIKPLDGAQLYVCPGADFDGIVTASDKNAYFTSLAETGTPVESYRKITTNNSADYTDMLAVVYGDKLTLVNITHAKIETITSVGTQITITGETK